MPPDPQMRWLRLWTDITSDPKIKMLAFEDRWHYVAILCMKRRGDVDGVTGELLERSVGVSLGLGDRDRDELKRRLMEVQLIDERWQPKAWKRRQFPSDSSAVRTRRWRKRSRDVSVTSQGSHGDALEQRQSREESPTPLGLDLEAWSRWLSYRQEIRKAIKSKSSIEAAQKLLAGFGTDQAAVVEQSIANGWQGLFALKDQPKPQKGGGNGLPFAKL